MKKLLQVLVICLSVLLLATNISAEKAKLYDDYGMLTNSEAIAVERELQTVSDKYGIDVVIHTTGSTKGKDIVPYADNFMDYYYLDNPNSKADECILLVIDMGNRETYISTKGQKTIAYFTDYGLDLIGQSVRSYLKNGDNYNAFLKFVDEVERYIISAQNGNIIDIHYNTVEIHMNSEKGKKISGTASVYDIRGSYIGQANVENGVGYLDVVSDDPNELYYVKNVSFKGDYLDDDQQYLVTGPYFTVNITAQIDPMGYVKKAGIAAAISALISSFYTAGGKGKNRSVHRKHEARSYLKRGLRLTGSRDIYLYTTHSRTKIEHNESDHGGSHSGGSSTHVSSSGSTHGGGGRGSF